MKVRGLELAVAFILAVVLWYGVSGSEKLESHVEVRVDYRGLPPGLLVTSGQLNKVNVKVRASMGMLRSLAGKDFAFYMDLSDLRKGENVLAVNSAFIPFRSGVEVIEVTPSRITLNVDTIESKVVPLVAQITGDVPVDHMVEASFDPSAITISGPSAVLEKLDEIVVSVPAEVPTEPGKVESKRIVPLPEGIDAKPNEVAQTVQINIRRKLVTVNRTVQFDLPAQFGKFVRPEKVTLAVAMPLSLAGKAAANVGIRAFVSLDQFDFGSYNLPVQVELPEGAELVEVDPPRVTVTIEQKNGVQPSK